MPICPSSVDKRQYSLLVLQKACNDEEVKVLPIAYIVCSLGNVIDHVLWTWKWSSINDIDLDANNRFLYEGKVKLLLLIYYLDLYHHSDVNKYILSIRLFSVNMGNIEDYVSFWSNVTPKHFNQCENCIACLLFLAELICNLFSSHNYVCVSLRQFSVILLALCTLDVMVIWHVILLSHRHKCVM